MKLNQLRDNPGARQTRILVGRGIGSGKGKTAGRGVKGQKARTGVAIKGFEGGQSPLLRRMPKRGFNNFENAYHYAVVTLEIIQAAIDGKHVKADKIDLANLHESGIVNHKGDGLKLVGVVGLTSKINITVTKASAGAIKAVEKAGGKVEVLPAKINKLLKPKKAAPAKK